MDEKLRNLDPTSYKWHPFHKNILVYLKKGWRSSCKKDELLHLLCLRFTDEIILYD